MKMCIFAVTTFLQNCWFLCEPRYQLPYMLALHLFPVIFDACMYAHTTKSTFSSCMALNIQ